LRVTPSVKDARDEDPILLERVEDKVREPPLEAFSRPQGDDLMALGQPAKTLQRSIEGKKEIEPKSSSLALIPPKGLVHFLFRFRQ
jgi:hypothetical protein